MAHIRSFFDSLIKEKSHEYMAACIEIAKQSPRNIRRPYVGALVLDREERVLGEGYKQFVGGTDSIMHAERVALDAAGRDVKGSLLFTTLEPCMHPPGLFLFKSCADNIIDAKINTLVFGMWDMSSSMRADATTYLINRGVNVVHYTRLNRRINDELMRADCKQYWNCGL